MMVEEWGMYTVGKPARQKTIEEYKEETKELEVQLRSMSSHLMNKMISRLHLWSGPFLIVERAGDHIDIEQIVKEEKSMGYNVNFNFIKRKARKWKRSDTLKNVFSRANKQIEPFVHEGEYWVVLSESRISIKSHLVDSALFHNKSSEWKNESSYATAVANHKKLLRDLERHEYWQ